MQKRDLMFLMAAALAATNDKGREFDPDEHGEPKKVIRPKGHKPFWVNGIEVWALNRKNAEKKYDRENAPFK